MSYKKTVDWQSNPIGRIIQKIRNALIQKRKRNGEFQPANWFHVLTWRLKWLNPFTSYNKGLRWIYFKSFFYNYYCEWEWLRYHTDTAFRLDKKIEKVVNQTISETDWINFYEHSRDGGPGVCYPHTNINVFHVPLGGDGFVNCFSITLFCEGVKPDSSLISGGSFNLKSIIIVYSTGSPDHESLTVIKGL